MGSTGGSETVTLLEPEIPAHSHALTASSQPGEDPQAVGESLARSVGANLYQASNANLGQMYDGIVTPAGGERRTRSISVWSLRGVRLALAGR